MDEDDLEPVEDLEPIDDEDVADEPSEEEDPLAALDADDEPAPAKTPSRGDRDYGALRRQAREAAERAERVERELQELKAAQSRPPQETPEARAQRLAMMTPEEYADYRVKEVEGSLANRLAAIEMRGIEREDKSNFEALCARNPALDKIKDQVEDRIKVARAQGLQVDRETVAKFLLGEAMLSKGATAAKKLKAETSARKAAQAATPSGSRGDVATTSTRGAKDEKAARAERLANIIL